MISFVKKYRHGLYTLAFVAFYLLCFNYLENRTDVHFNLIDSKVDALIPFCEYFIIPYLIWFPYQILVAVYFIFTDKDGYMKLFYNLAFGMTFFIIISYIYPNILNLRPSISLPENVFQKAVLYLYSKDTATNVFPSIHVFNSIAMHMAVCESERLKRFVFLRNSSLMITILIVMSTMFLKQHSVIDVIYGILLSSLGYVIIYGYMPKYHPEREKAKLHFEK